MALDDTYIAVDDLVVLCIFDNLKNFSDGSVNVCTDTADENGIFICAFTSLSTKLNRQSLVFTNDSGRENE